MQKCLMLKLKNIVYNKLFSNMRIDANILLLNDLDCEIKDILE